MSCLISPKARKRSQGKMVTSLVVQLLLPRAWLPRFVTPPFSQLKLTGCRALAPIFPRQTLLQQLAVNSTQRPFLKSQKPRSCSVALTNPFQAVQQLKPKSMPTNQSTRVIFATSLKARRTLQAGNESREVQPQLPKASLERVATTTRSVRRTLTALHSSMILEGRGRLLYPGFGSVHSQKDMSSR
jgi:hypothetical protein